MAPPPRARPPAASPPRQTAQPGVIRNVWLLFSVSLRIAQNGVFRKALREFEHLPFQQRNQRPSMKVFLRNTLTGNYYQGPSQWTAHRGQALDLKQMSRATQLAVGTHLEHVEILLCYDHPDYNIVLPLDLSRTQS